MGEKDVPEEAADGAFARREEGFDGEEVVGAGVGGGREDEAFAGATVAAAAANFLAIGC